MSFEVLQIRAGDKIYIMALVRMVDTTFKLNDRKCYSQLFAKLCDYAR